MPVIVLPMHQDDIDAVASIHSEGFPRQKNSLKWTSCNFAAFPRIMVYVARNEKDKIIGYIQWIQKSGFRQKSVIELEQIAVLKNYQKKGVGTSLIKKSLESIKDYLNGCNSSLKAILISTRTNNAAKALYKKALGAEEIALIQDLYSADEAILIAREV